MKFKITQHENWVRTATITADNEDEALEKFQGGDFDDGAPDEFDYSDVTACQVEEVPE